VTDFQPAPKQLAMLATAMRGWDYEEIRAAIIAASQAGWGSERIYRETFRLLLLADASPADLRIASRNPARGEAGPGAGLPSREDAVALVAAYRARVAGQPAPDDPEGGEAA
jgi:hypothetical protein